MLETSDTSVLTLAILLVLIAILVLLCLWGIVKVAEVFREPSLSPQEKVMHQIGRVLSPVSATITGKVRVYGEIWDALAANSAEPETLPVETEVRVVGIDPVNPQVLHVVRLER